MYKLEKTSDDTQIDFNDIKLNLYDLDNLSRISLRILEKLKSEEMHQPHFNLSVLGVGAYGISSFLRLISGYGYEVLGVEHPKTRDEKLDNNFFLPVQDYLPNSSEQFKLGIVFDILDYIKEPLIVLNHIEYLLPEGGEIFIRSIDDALGIKANLNDLGFKVLGSQNSHGYSWILARKIKGKVNRPDIAEFRMDTAQLDFLKIRRLSDKKESRSSSIIQKGITAFHEDPSQVPRKVIQKLFGNLELPYAYKGVTASAQYVGVRPKNKKKTLKLAHVGLHFDGNAGDTLLFPAVRLLFQKEVFPTDFTLIPLREQVTEETIDIINQQDGLIIGGGGLFLSDSNPNEHSGWQWACPLHLLDKIKVPIILFAVGYNQFRGQSEFSPIFKKNLQRLVSKSEFVGVRNQGSIKALKSYLPDFLHKKIYYQPCPTTLLSKFYPELPERLKTNHPILGVNIAFDRYHLRFGERENEILWNIADALLELKSQGWEIKLFNNFYVDGDVRYWFKSRGLFVEEINLGEVTPIDVLKAYSKTTIVTGMRGHAQMIPFGLNCPIYSLISHNKLQFFLDDINHPEWGTEVRTDNLAAKLANDLSHLYLNLSSIELQLEEAQNRLWEITLQNLKIIQSMMK